MGLNGLGFNSSTVAARCPIARKQEIETKASCVLLITPHNFIDLCRDRVSRQRTGLRVGAWTAR